MLQFKNKKTNDRSINFAKALEYMESPNEIIFQDENEVKPDSDKGNQLKNLMLRELNSLSEIIIKHPDFLINQMSNDEKTTLKRFLDSFSTCPICQQKNHSYNLKKAFIKEDNNFLNILSRLKKFDRSVNYRIKLKFGIPCCTCYKRIFEQT
ncbi:MAG: hypothetical protein ACFFAS_17535 [Promethearchaeota archaeon]